MGIRDMVPPLPLYPAEAMRGGYEPKYNDTLAQLQFLPRAPRSLHQSGGSPRHLPLRSVIIQQEQVDMVLPDCGV